MTDEPVPKTAELVPKTTKCPDCMAELQRLTAGHRKSRWHRANVEPKELAKKGWVETSLPAYQLREHEIEYVSAFKPSRYDHGRTQSALYADSKHITMFAEYDEALKLKLRGINTELTAKRAPFEKAIREIYEEERAQKASVSEAYQKLFVLVLAAEKSNAWTPELLEARRQFQAQSVEASMDQETEE